MNLRIIGFSLILMTGCGPSGFRPLDVTSESGSYDLGTNPISCSISVSSNQVVAGSKVTLMMATQGPVSRAVLNGQAVSVSGGAVDTTPVGTMTFSGEVEAASGQKSTCRSEIVTVTPAVGQNPSCSIVASVNNLVPGDSTNLTLTVVGSGLSTTLNGQNFGATGGAVTLRPNTSTLVSGSVRFTSGTATCSLQILVKTRQQLTKDELYRATLGPSNSSVDSLLTTRCAICHSGLAGSNPTASSWLIIKDQDTSGNLTRLKRVVNPSTGAVFSNMTQAPLNTSIWQFMSGHKAKNPPYTQTDLDWASAYVNTP